MCRFKLKRIYHHLGSWRLTARFLMELLQPVEILLWQILSYRLDQFICKNGVLSMIGVNQSDIIKEAEAMISCYQQLYPQLMTTRTWPRYLMLEAWYLSPKSDLWEEEAFVLGYPPSCQNLGFLTRLIIQDHIDLQVSDMTNQTLDVMRKPRSLLSVRNLLLTVIPMDM